MPEKKRMRKETRFACLFFLFGSSSIIRFLSIVSYERPFTIQICEHLNIFRNNKVPSLPMQNGKVDGNRPRTHPHTPYTHLHELESVKNFAQPLYRCVCVCVCHCIGVCRCVSLVIVANLVTNKHILYVLSRFFSPSSSRSFVSTWTHGLCAWPPARVATYGDAIKGEENRSRNRKENETRNKRRKIRTRIRKFHANTLILLSGKFAKQANFSIYNQTKWGRQEEGRGKLCRQGRLPHGQLISAQKVLRRALAMNSTETHTQGHSHSHRHPYPLIHSFTCSLIQSSCIHAFTGP